MNVEPVHVWLIDTARPDDVVADLVAVLDDEERARAQALRRDVDRRRFVVAHGALRMIVGAWLGAPPAELRWRRGAHGKPELDGRWTGAQVNLSHSGDLNAVAVSAYRPVGLDVQHLLHHTDPVAMAARYFLPAEARHVADGPDADQRAERFARLWARKEACVKAAGSTLARGLQLPVHGDGAAEAVVVGEPGRALPGPFRVTDVAVGPGFRGSVALVGADPFEVVSHRW